MIMVEEIKCNTALKKAKLKKEQEEEAKLLKIQKEYNRQLINFLNDEKINQNKSKCLCAKNQKNYNEEKRKIENHNKRMKLKAELEKKLIEEYKLKEEAENKRSKAEQEELEMIKKLQTTTQLHKNIADELEKMNINSVMRGDYDFDGVSGNSLVLRGGNIGNSNLNSNLSSVAGKRILSSKIHIRGREDNKFLFWN